MMTGIGVHHRSEWVFTLARNDRSRWAGIRTRLADDSHQFNRAVQHSTPRRCLHDQDCKDRLRHRNDKKDRRKHVERQCGPDSNEAFGATARCKDRTWSKSQNRSGTCSWHKGVVLGVSGETLSMIGIATGCRKIARRSAQC